MKKEIYQSPRIEIIEVQNEGIMAGSPLSTIPGKDFVNNTRSSAGTNNRGVHQTVSPIQELEDMLNDLFTIMK